MPASSTAKHAARWIRPRRARARCSAQFRDWRSRLSNADFTVSHERVYLRTPAQLENDPAMALRLFEFVARHGIPLAAETERRLEESREAFAGYCAVRPTVVASAARHPVAAARRHGAARHARYRPDPGPVPRMGEHRVPGGSGLLSSLHRGRAHAGGHREARRTGRHQGSRAASIRRNTVGDRRPRAAALRPAVSRCRQRGQQRRPRAPIGGTGARRPCSAFRCPPKTRPAWSS